MKLIAIFLFVFPVRGICQNSSAEIFKTLLQKEQSLLDGVATGNKTLWNKLLHDSCIITTEDGRASSKQKLVEEMNPLPQGYTGRIVIIEPLLKVYGNTAVISFINDEYLELFNQKIHTQYRQTDTWIKMGEEWKMVAMQLFEIPKTPSPISVHESVLKQYTGTYVLSTEIKCSVYVEKARLYAKKNNREAQELLAETENVFFRNGDGRVNIIFLKDNNGKYKMIERREGEDLIWTKLN